MNRSYRTHSALVGQLNRLFDGVMKPLPGTTRPEQLVTFDETHALTAQRESPTTTSTCSSSASPRDAYKAEVDHHRGTGDRCTHP
ncbi:MAG: hypothetical protein HND48_13670 [Chloroflexi bacterium]|nr:hypothetical protein [Chloroflexota bacterium]